MKSIDLIHEDLRRHKVSVTLPGEQEEKSLYLILITAKTSKLEDFWGTYGDKATAIHQKIAQKVFGTEETENVYGALIDESLRMIFAFNRDFADYDSNNKTIVFKDIDDVLINRIEAKKEVEKTELEIKEMSPIQRPKRKSMLPNDIGEWLIRYSLTENEK